MAGAIGIGRFAYTPLLPDMMTSFGWSFAQAGDVASANFVGYMVGAVLAPYAAIGPQVRLWLALSFMASVATTYLGAEVRDYLPWLVLRFGSGVASAYCLVIVTAQLMQTLAREPGRAFGNVHFAGVGVGILVCMAVLSLDGYVHQHWSRLGGVAAALMAGAWFLIARDPLQPVGGPAESGGERGDLGALWRLVVGYGFFGFGYVVSATFIVAVAAGLEPPVSGETVWLVVGLALVPSVYLWQWIANRVGTVRALQAAYLVESAGALITAFGGTLAALTIGGVLLGGTFAAITALGLSAAREQSPRRVAAAVSAMTAAFALGQLVGPAVAGRMADHFGDFAWPSAAAAVLLGASALLLIKRRGAPR